MLVIGKSTESTIAKLAILYKRADLWAKHYASVFVWQKYKLIHFIYKGDTG
jgi:hypothetical protein